jgi:hypothetical protein
VLYRRPLLLGSLGRELTFYSPSITSTYHPITSLSALHIHAREQFTIPKDKFTAAHLQTIAPTALPDEPLISDTALKYITNRTDDDCLIDNDCHMAMIIEPGKMTASQSMDSVHTVGQDDEVSIGHSSLLLGFTHKKKLLESPQKVVADLSFTSPCLHSPRVLYDSVSPVITAAGVMVIIS